MLERIRENSRSFGTYLILGAIIVVFVVYFGPASTGCQGMSGGGAPAAWAAKVDGDEISIAEYQSQLNMLIGQLGAQTGGQADPQMIEALGLRQRALDQAVTRKLVLDLAHEQGLAVSNDEVKEVIRKTPEFQRDGHFDFDTYKLVLANNGWTTTRFEGTVRDDLLRSAVLNQVRQAAKVTDAEIEAEFLRENDKASVTFTRFAAQAFLDDAKSTPEEIAAFLATPEGKEKVESKYEAESFKYKQPKRVRAQHILVKVEEDAPQADVDAARAKVEAAKARVEGGEDFAAVAKEVSEDAGSAEKGGDVGLFGPGAMVKPFEDAAMALEPGSLSEPVRSRFGFHLIKVNEVVPASEKQLAEVQDEIAAELLKRDKARELARAAAEKTLAEAKAGKSLADQWPMQTPETAASENKPKAFTDDTGAFAVGSDFVPRIGAAGELSKDVANANAGDVLPKVYEVSDTFVVATVAERTKPDMSKLAESKDAIRERLLFRKQNELVDDFTRKIREKAKVERNDQLFASAS